MLQGCQLVEMWRHVREVNYIVLDEGPWYGVPQFPCWGSHLAFSWNKMIVGGTRYTAFSSKLSQVNLFKKNELPRGCFRSFYGLCQMNNYGSDI